MHTTRSEFCLVKRRVGNRIIYYYSFYDDDGVRRYRSTGCRTKAAALDYVMKKREEGMLRTMHSTRITFGQYAKDFFVWDKCPLIKSALERGRHFSKSTAQHKRYLFIKHVFPYFQDMQMNLITPRKINSWLLSFSKEHNLKPHSANKVFSYFSQVMDYAVKDGVIPHNPCDKVEKLGGTSKRCNAFTAEEVRAIIGKPEDWSNFLHRTICYIAALTGMRIAEIFALKPENIKPDRIEVAWSYNSYDKRKSTKTGTIRTVPITPSLHDLILSCTNGPDKYIFSTKEGNTPFSYGGFRIAFMKRLESLGIKDKTFHSFRAFVDTELTMSNINESVIRSVIGHRDENMTEHYLHLETGDLSLIINAQNKIEESFA